jgi:hypothetical protein
MEAKDVIRILDQAVTAREGSQPHPQRQRPRIRGRRRAGLDRPERVKDPLYQTRQPVAERVQRKLQQPLPRRVPEPGSLRVVAGGESPRRRTPAVAQPRPAPLVLGRPDPRRIRAAQPYEREIRFETRSHSRAISSRVLSEKYWALSRTAAKKKRGGVGSLTRWEISPAVASIRNPLSVCLLLRQVEIGFYVPMRRMTNFPWL